MGNIIIPEAALDQFLQSLLAVTPSLRSTEFG
jgi:hypothetical protein